MTRFISIIASLTFGLVLVAPAHAAVTGYTYPYNSPYRISNLYPYQDEYYNPQTRTARCVYLGSDGRCLEYKYYYNEANTVPKRAQYRNQYLIPTPSAVSPRTHDRPNYSRSPSYYQDQAQKRCYTDRDRYGRATRTICNYEYPGDYNWSW